MSGRPLLEIFQETGAILEGHFLLSSGLHSSHYVQCARIFEDPHLAANVVEDLTSSLSGITATWVVGPALGGILLAYELARKLRTRNAFTERVDGKMTLRRGFFIPAGSAAIVAEDVLTTGGSALETAKALEDTGIRIEGVVALVNRSNVQLPYPTRSLISLSLSSYKPEECPLCKENKPIAKPGSRSSARG